MSGQYPGGYNSPLGAGGGVGRVPGQQQQMPGQMVAGAVGMGTMAGPAGMMGPQGGGPGMMQMGPYGQQQQPGMMPQQQQQIPMGMSPGAVGGMQGMQSPSHIQQQQMMQQQMHMQQQQQQQQQQMQQQQPGPSQIQTAVGPAVAPGGLPPAAVAAGPATSQTTTPRTVQNYSSIVGWSLWGQETVQDIAQRFQEIFAALKIIQPTMNREANTERKVQEFLRTIRLLFKRLRLLYEKCNEGYPQGMEYTTAESLIPYRDEPEHRIETVQCEEYRKALQENQELIETVKLKNRQIREIIDRTRTIIWEINTMLSMRRS